MSQQGEFGGDVCRVVRPWLNLSWQAFQSGELVGIRRVGDSMPLDWRAQHETVVQDGSQWARCSL